MIKAWKISGGNQTWEGTVFLPEHPKALVLFAHGSGSGKGSTRNLFMADFFHEHEFASFLFDLTTKEEAASDFFDLPDFTNRLARLTAALKKDPQLGKLPLIYFGGSTGAAVALAAAVEQGKFIHGVICRGGRVDLADHLAIQVTCPVLLIVGEKDQEVLRWNREFFRKLKTKKSFELIADAGHLFDEPGKLREVGDVSLAWLLQVVSKNKTTTFSTFYPSNQPNV